MTKIEDVGDRPAVEMSDSTNTRTWVLASRPGTEKRTPPKWIYTGEGFDNGQVWSCGHTHDAPLPAYACAREWMGLTGLDRPNPGK